MKKENEKDLDDLFKRQLDDPGEHIAYRESDWHDLEQMLDKGKKRRGLVYWLPVLGGIAALLLLFLGWWVFKPAAVVTQPGGQLAGKKYQDTSHTGTRGGSTQQPAGQGPADRSSAQFPGLTRAGGSSRGEMTSPAVGGRRDTTGQGNNGIVNRQPAAAIAAATQQPGKQKDAITAAMAGNDTIQGTAVAINKPKAINSVKPNGQDTVQGATIATNRNVVKKPDTIQGAVNASNKPKIKVKPPFRPQFAIGVLAASDLNGVNSLQQGKLGSNIGLMFSANVSRKLTLSTGAIYSVKPYSTSFANYHTGYTFKSDPTNVVADCRMLDIPINVGYQVYSKNRNKISLGTGLSSYIMLHESYKYSYSSAYPTGPSEYTVAKPGKYFLGVMNLSATYERQINSKVGLSIQPYVKLPLANIGYSQVKLQTTGIAVGLSWNLNSLSKP